MQADAAVSKAEENSAAMPSFDDFSSLSAAREGGGAGGGRDVSPPHDPWSPKEDAWGGSGSPGESVDDGSQQVRPFSDTRHTRNDPRAPRKCEYR